jgi:PAS domain S-box-containing protein
MSLTMVCGRHVEEQGLMERAPITERTARELTRMDPRRVLDALEVGVIVHDAALRILYTNRTAAALLGVEIAEAVQRDVADPRWVVIHPDGSMVLPEEVPASVALRTRKVARGMILGVRQRDGVTTWLAADGVPLLRENGEIELIAVTISDVTRELVARLQLEHVRDSLDRTIQERDAALGRAVRALESSEARYRAVLRSMSEGVAVHAPDGSILFANPAAERILGLSLEQMRGQHPVEPSWRLTDTLGVPLPPDQIPSEITRRTGLPQRNVLLRVRRGGSEAQAWLCVNTDPIDHTTEPTNGGNYSVVATFLDITAELLALDEARQTRDHLRELAAALPGVVAEYVLRPDGSLRFRYVSEPAREYFGIEPQDALRDGAAALARVHVDDREMVLACIREAAASNTSTQIAFRVMHPDGGCRHARLRSGPPTHDPEGPLFRSVVSDVTEQHRLEETVREAQRREAMGTLAAGMAHNFNNMLAVIVPSLEMIRAQLPEAVRADVDDARAAARAAAELVRQLMQVVRKDAPGPAVTVDLAALVEEIAQMCGRTFDPGIELRCDVPRLPLWVLARRAELQQVLVNLCINARDALAGRPKPLVTLRVTLERDTSVVSVADNGAGMPPEVQRRLGEPFFSTKPPGRGTGLGLATAYGIVFELGGSLSCESKLGEGTRFELRLPRHRVEVEAGSAKAESSVPARGLHVLLIDDEDLVRNTLKRAVERTGATVLAAMRGSDGLELLRAHPEIGLVLLDLAMPDIDGMEVLRRLRQVNDRVPVYLMTGFLPPKLDTTGASGVLSKPLDLTQLNELLASVAGV